MLFPRFVQIRQNLPDRSIADIPQRIHQELAASPMAARVPAGSRLAIGVGSRGIANIATIVKAVVQFWKDRGVHPFVFPAMGSHGAATAEGQADVLAHFGIHEATIGAPVVSSLDVIQLGQTPEDIQVYLDKQAAGSDGIFLVGRLKWHTDFEGDVESGLCKMMAIGLGKLAGAQQYHSFAYKLGMERVIRSAAAVVVQSGKVVGGLAIQEGAHHETAGLVAVSALDGVEALIAREAELLREVKSWMAKLPAPEIDVLIVDVMGKNISGSGMDTKVINRLLRNQNRPFPWLPKVHRIFTRSLSPHSYHNGIGIGLADVIHDRLLADIDWTPTTINALTAGAPASIRTPMHFPTDRECLERVAPTVGKTDLTEVTYCRIQDTLELEHCHISENLIGALSGGSQVVSAPFDIPFDTKGDLTDFDAVVEAEKDHQASPSYI